MVQLRIQFDLFSGNLHAHSDETNTHTKTYATQSQIMNIGCLDYLINKHQVFDNWYLNGNWDSYSVSLKGVLADGQDLLEDGNQGRACRLASPT